MTDLVLDQLNLVCDDMEATLSFYRLLGLDIPETSVWRTESGAHHVEVKMTNGFELAFDSSALASVYNSGLAQRPNSGTKNVVSFRVHNRQMVDTICKKLEASGHPISQEPYDTFWGSRYAIIEDPDGNLVGLMSTPDPTLRSSPPRI